MTDPGDCSVKGIDEAGDFVGEAPGARVERFCPFELPRERGAPSLPAHTTSKRTDIRTMAMRGEHGTSLVGLVVMLGLLGGLAALVFSSVTRTEPGVNLTGGPSDSPVPAGGARPGSAITMDVASVVPCKADVAAIEGAMGAARVTAGVVPTTLSELVATGFLSESPDRPGFTYAPELVGDEGTGEADGKRPICARRLHIEAHSGRKIALVLTRVAFAK